jgi:hypothetical protein
VGCRPRWSRRGSHRVEATPGRCRPVQQRVIIPDPVAWYGAGGGSAARGRVAMVAAAASLRWLVQQQCGQCHDPPGGLGCVRGRWASVGPDWPVDGTVVDGWRWAGPRGAAANLLYSSTLAHKPAAKRSSRSGGCIWGPSVGRSGRSDAPSSPGSMSLRLSMPIVCQAIVVEGVPNPCLAGLQRQTSTKGEERPRRAATRRPMSGWAPVCGCPP